VDPHLAVLPLGAHLHPAVRARLGHGLRGVDEEFTSMRTTVMATHTEAQLDDVLDAFQRAGERAGAIAPALRKAG
jgi:uncharacterized protein YqgV (UPF0045/DUF77 family)